MTPIATRILEAQLHKRRSAELVKLAIGAGAYSSSPVGRGSSPASNPHAVSSATPRLSPSEKAMAPSLLPSLKDMTSAGSKALTHAGTATWNNGGQSALNAAADAGSAIWNNGGKQLATPVWNYGGKQLVNSGLNTMHGISTVGRGAASTAGGWAGNTLGGAGWLGASGTDALGLTNNGARWVEDNVLKHTNNAIGAGMHDIGHGLADTLSVGAYDYDGTFANPGEHGGTAVEQARSGIRDQLGRGSDLNTAFSVANGASDFAADMASTGAAGRGVNVAAKAIRGSRAAAPVLNAVAKAPAVGRPLAAAGNWLSGAAPETNMFRQSMPQYYRSALGPKPTLPRMTQQLGDDAFTAYNAATQPDVPHEARMYNATAPLRDPINTVEQAAFENNEPLPENMRIPSELREMHNAAHYGIPVDPMAEQYAATQAPPMGDVSYQDFANGAPDELIDAAVEHNNQQSQFGAPGGTAGPVEPSYAGMAAAPQQPAATPQQPTATTQQPAATPQQPTATTRQPTATTQQSTAATEQPAATPRQPIDAQSYITRLQSARPEEQGAIRQEFADHVVKNADPQLAQSATAYQQNPKSPEAELFLNSLGDKRQEFEKQVTADALQKQPAAVNNPDMFGQIAAQAGQAWDAIGPAGQMAMAFGVPAAMIGLLGGGGLSMILGGLGLGAMGLAGAGMGMFGAGGQARVGKLMGDAGNFFGVIPDEARDAANLAPDSPAAKAFEKQVAQTYMSKGQTEAQKLIDSRTAQFKPLEQMYSASPDAAYSYLMGMNNGPKTREEAEALYQQLAGQAAAARDPQFLSRKIEEKTPAWLRSGVQRGVQAYGNAPGWLQSGVSALLGAGTTEKPAADRTIRALVQKTARCWAGYEPVPGKAPYSENSCRPKATKKKQPRKATHAHKQQNGS